MLDHPHQQSYYWFVGNFHAYLHTITNFITPFFLKILQRNSKPVILGNLGISSHKLLKRVSIWRKLWYLSAGKKSASSFMFSLRHCKYIANLLFWVLTVYLAMQTKVLLSTCRKLPHLQTKNQLHPTHFSGVLGTLGMSAYAQPKW